MQKKFLLITIIILFILAVFSITSSYLIINKDNKGNVIVHKNYFDIIFSNAYIECDSKSSIKIDNENDFIHINIPNLNEIKSNCSFYIDMTNIGNVNKNIITNITNFSSNVSENDVLINTNIENGNTINGGEVKRVRINIDYKNKINETPKLGFNVNFKFE